mmetsp:Transcript_15548/g.33461  ORF Transcript_15548/g.33461 Transcript_15548/m.33461 type:complete len:93 (-) Transcript_15548:3-281(-)
MRKGGAREEGKVDGKLMLKDDKGVTVVWWCDSSVGFQRRMRRGGEREDEEQGEGHRTQGTGHRTQDTAHCLMLMFLLLSVCLGDGANKEEQA